MPKAASSAIWLATLARSEDLDMQERNGVSASRSSAEDGSVGVQSAAPDLADWRVGHLTRLVIYDAIVIWVSLSVATWVKFGNEAFGYTAANVSYGVVTAVIAAGWLLALSSRGAYEPRHLGAGPEEYKRLTQATVVTFATVAVISYAFKLEIARTLFAVAPILGLTLLVLERFLARQRLVRRRQRGEALSRVLAVGSSDAVAELVSLLEREPNAGYHVVGASGTFDDVRAALRRTAADTVAITASADMTSARLREIAWEIEGTNIQLVVQPRLVDVAGPRIEITPVGGLPLLHVDEAQFRGWRRLLKNSLDWSISVVALIGLGPFLLLLGLLVRLTSPGPALFRQARVGADGKVFQVYKLRTMYVDAEADQALLREANEADGRLFKIKQDPRVTKPGRLLRRTSLDELPQLLNVLRGEMSLVGPRPLPVNDTEMAGHERRRLIVRPGMTGLWQVSGRSDLSWEDAVRLDLYYVENWSITLDALIMLRTVAAVVRGSGAY
jgi:exopolysaccharide biosynthesis polyprenyl glycosylphosphotransferase